MLVHSKIDTIVAKKWHIDYSNLAAHQLHRGACHRFDYVKRNEVLEEHLLLRANFLGGIAGGDARFRPTAQVEEHGTKI